MAAFSLSGYPNWWNRNSHHPILNRRIDFGKSEVASFRRELFSELRYKRKFALRLGHVTKESDWRLSPRLTRHVDHL